MGRNEIRLRRQKMSSGRIAQHRNYSEVMARHEQDIKIRRIVKVFIYFLIIAFLLIVFMIVSRWEQKQHTEKPNTAQAFSTSISTSAQAENETAVTARLDLDDSIVK